MEIFEKLNNNLKISSTFLFYGDLRIDLKEMAFKFSKLILNDDKILNNPDFYYYNDIKIDDVREIILNSVESSYANSNRVYIIDNVSKIKKEAINALLKLLEEPPKFVYFILLTNSLNILDTIKSRSIIVNLNLENSKNKIVNKELYKLLEYDNKAYNECIDKEYSLEINEYIKNIDDIYIIFNEYFNEKNSYNKLKYTLSIKYLIENIKFMSIEEIYILKEKIFSILQIDKDNKKTRDNIYDFFKSVILKLSYSEETELIEKLLEYKIGIYSNVNLKLTFFLFFSKIIKI